MISELRIPPGPVGEFTAPHLEEGNAKRQERRRFLTSRGGTGICPLSRSCLETVFPPSHPRPPPPALTHFRAGVWVSAVEAGESRGWGGGEPPTIELDTQAPERCRFSEAAGVGLRPRFPGSGAHALPREPSQEGPGTEGPMCRSFSSPSGQGRLVPCLAEIFAVMDTPGPRLPWPWGEKNIVCSFA